MEREILDNNIPSEDFRWRGEEGIRRGVIKIGGMSAEQLEQEMEEEDIIIGRNARGMLRRLVLPARESQQLELAILEVGRDLGLKGYSTLDQILARGEELGYKRVPQETAAYLRAAYNNQLLYEVLFMAMDPISDSAGSPRIFELGRRAGRLWLRDVLVSPARRASPEDAFVFGLDE